MSRIHAKCNQRLYFLRKSKNAKVEPTTLTLFSKSIIQYVLSFCISSWFGNCLERDKSRLRKTIRCAAKLGCVKDKQLRKLYEDAVREKLDKILRIGNQGHPLHDEV